MSPLETQKNVLPFLRECFLLAPTFLSLDNHEWMLDSTDLITLASAFLHKEMVFYADNPLSGMKIPCQLSPAGIDLSKIFAASAIFSRVLAIWK